MATANAIIRAALGKLGIVSPGESVKPNDAADCLLELNRLVDAWRLERLFAYATVTTDAAVAADVTSRTIGPTGQIVVTARPERFEAGCYYTAGGVDYPLEPITEAEYTAILTKQIETLGTVWFTYNPALPNGTLRFWPAFASAATLHLVTQQHFTAFANLTTDYGLPAGAERALMFTLAEEVAANFEREIPPTVARNAANARRLYKRGNHTVPQLTVGDMGTYSTILSG